METFEIDYLGVGSVAVSTEGLLKDKLDQIVMAEDSEYVCDSLVDAYTLNRCQDIAYLRHHEFKELKDEYEISDVALQKLWGLDQNEIYKITEDRRYMTEVEEKLFRLYLCGIIISMATNPEILKTYKPGNLIESSLERREPHNVIFKLAKNEQGYYWKVLNGPATE